MPLCTAPLTTPSMVRGVSDESKRILTPIFKLPAVGVRLRICAQTRLAVSKRSVPTGAVRTTGAVRFAPVSVSVCTVVLSPCITLPSVTVAGDIASAGCNGAGSTTLPFTFTLKITPASTVIVSLRMRADAEFSRAKTVWSIRPLFDKDVFAVSVRLGVYVPFADAEISTKLAAAEADLAKAQTNAMASIESVAAEAATDIVAKLSGAKVNTAQAALAVKAVLG